MPHQIPRPRIAAVTRGAGWAMDRLRVAASVARLRYRPVTSGATLDRVGGARSSQPYLAAGVLGEQRPRALIGTEHAFTLMPGLGLDGVLGYIRSIGARHEP